MAITQPRSRRRTRRIEGVHKPAGTFHPRVEKVAPEKVSGTFSLDIGVASR